MASSQSVVKLVLDDTNCVEVNLHGKRVSIYYRASTHCIYMIVSFNNLDYTCIKCIK